MSTRTNIVIDYGESRVILYRHMDGYPTSVGVDLLEKLAAAKDATGFVVSLLAEQYDAEVYRAAHPIYELTTEIHGDIDYLYRVKFSQDWAATPNPAEIGVLDLTFSGGKSDLRGNATAEMVILGTAGDFAAYVNVGIREQNKRCAELRKKHPNVPGFEDQAEVAA